jgi:hypothetical protein
MIKYFLEIRINNDKKKKLSRHNTAVMNVWELYNLVQR